ncbi:MAG: PDZ domain-containing protein [Acidobacteria bacterium]|nr:MAG: PDZ domain-containing protein [Acidobacteriota bacterium]
MRTLSGTTIVALLATSLVLAGDPPAPPAPAPAAPEPERPLIVVRTPEGEQLVWVNEQPTARRAWVGIRLTEMTPELRAHFGAPEDHGVLISRVVPDSPAARAGLEVGDIVLAIDGRPVQGLAEFQRTVFEHEPGDDVTLTVLRDRRETAVQVELGVVERPQVDLGRIVLEGGRIRLDRLVDQVRALARVEPLRRVEIAPIAIDEERLEKVVEQLRRRAEADAAAAAAMEAAAADTEASRREQEALERRRELLERRLRELEKKIEELERRIGR